MKWFKHDTDASTDAKIRKLIIRHGAIGYAVYFHCLELIAGDLDHSNFTFELEHDSEIIADNLKISGDANNSGTDLVENIMRSIIDLDLFQCSNERIFCIKLAKRLDSSMTSNAGFRELIKKGHDRVMIESGSSHDVVMQDYTTQEVDKTKTDKTIKKKINKKESQPFTHYTGQPEKSPTKTIFSEITNYWNEKVPEQATPFTSLNMSLSGDIIVLLEQTDIQVVKTAIDHYGKAYEHNKYRVAGFSNFMTMKNIESWYPESSVENRKPDEVKEEEDKPVYKKGSIKWN